MNEELIAPIVTSLVGAAVGIAAAIIAKRSKKAEVKDTRAPDVDEAWVQAEHARRQWFFWQEAYFALRGVFKSLARRVVDRHPDFELTTSELDAIDKTPSPPE